MNGGEGVYGRETFREDFDNFTQKIGLIMINMKDVGNGSAISSLRPIPEFTGIWEGGNTKYC